MHSCIWELTENYWSQRLNQTTSSESPDRGWEPAFQNIRLGDANLLTKDEQSKGSGREVGHCSLTCCIPWEPSLSPCWSWPRGKTTVLFWKWVVPWQCQSGRQNQSGQVGVHQARSKRIGVRFILCEDSVSAKTWRWTNDIGDVGLCCHCGGKKGKYILTQAASFNCWKVKHTCVPWHPNFCHFDTVLFQKVSASGGHIHPSWPRKRKHMVLLWPPKWVPCIDSTGED